MSRYVALLLLALQAVYDCRTLASGNIGCLFSDTLCERDSEWCFDDHAFGRCSPSYGHYKNDLQTYDLGSEDLRLLEQEMQRLFMLGYRWSHTYTQCVLQTLLHSISHKTKFDLSTCNGELDQDLEGAIRAIEGEELEQVDPRNLAIVRFTPSATDPHTDFADEVYFPPIREGAAHNGFTPSASGDDGDAHADFADEVYFPPGGESNAINGDREHQESATSEPGASSGPPRSAGAHRPQQEGIGAGGGGALPANPPGPPTDHASAPSLPHDHPMLHDDGQFDYYGENDYDDYQSPYHFQSPVSPMMFRKRGMGLPRGNDALYQDAALPSKLAAIFDIRRMRDSRQQAFQPRNQYPTPEERVAFPERLLKNEFGYDDGDEDEDEGVFEEQPVRPAYAQRLQFFGGNEDLLGPSVESNAWSPDRRLEESQRGEGMRNNMPDLLQESLDLQDILRSFRPQMGGGGGPGYPSNAPAFPSMSRNTNFQDYAGIPQERLPEFVLPDPYLPEIPRPRFGLESGPGPEAAFFDRRDDLEEYQLEQLEQEVEKELARESPRTSALREAFGPQLNALDDYGNDYDEYGGLDDYSDYPGGRQMLFGDSPFALQKKDEETLGDDYAELLAGEDLNFQRPEREDVKKPGPPYSVNNFAFKNSDGEEENDRGYEELDDQEPVAEGGDVMLPRLLQEGRAFPPEQLDLREVNDLQAAAKLLGPAIQPEEQVPDLLLDDEVLVDKASDDVNVGDPKMARLKAVSEEPMPTQASTETPHYKPISPDTVYINVNRSFESWAEAKKLADLVMREAGLGGDHLGELSKDGGQVTFRIKENGRGITASDVAKKANDQDLREQVKKKLGLEIMGTEAVTKKRNGEKPHGEKNSATKRKERRRREEGGKTPEKWPRRKGRTLLALGRRIEHQSAMSVPVFSPSENHILAAAAIVCGVMAALLVGATVLFFLRRHAKSRAKLQGLTAHDTEASKDYQDLCRARMAGKTGGEGGKTEPAPTHAQGQRVSSLSRDSDNGNNSPSSRSSTSSWSEEPVASNMDISTGHMVLSYMEDHLKNKDRLEQEWIALCAYEAEPCATTLALKPENNKKNRYPDAVPYDHNRVVLNAHANVNGSDYINASSITDHDPRNPAYIATQGPLDATAADFWQLVWEQGSVVIVMLTRLTENGHAFCHRYWPEEGSDLYHIYEVHLVSEHIWCDDYLVRSFYLKNVRTGETRTVTQFHFLSWPDSGTPASTKALLEFRRKVNKSYRGRSCPIIVHCSDGIGRTGTYCLIDMVLNRMAKGAKEIDIAATLEHIRDQRPHMVKSKAQFEFVLMAVAEEVHAILKALPQ